MSISSLTDGENTYFFAPGKVSRVNLSLVIPSVILSRWPELLLALEFPKAPDGNKEVNLDIPDSKILSKVRSERC